MARAALSGSHRGDRVAVSVVDTSHICATCSARFIAKPTLLLDARQWEVRISYEAADGPVPSPSGDWWLVSVGAYACTSQLSSGVGAVFRWARRRLPKPNDNAGEHKQGNQQSAGEHPLTDAAEPVGHLPQEESD